jgi:hypothetical protein
VENGVQGRDLPIEVVGEHGEGVVGALTQARRHGGAELPDESDDLLHQPLSHGQSLAEYGRVTLAQQQEELGVDRGPVIPDPVRAPKIRSIPRIWIGGSSVWTGRALKLVR